MSNSFVLASNNQKKAAELRSLLPGLNLLSLEDIGFHQSIPEPFDSFEENAWTKAETVRRFCSLPVIADDSGLCVEVLNGAPGVKSARYAGEPSDDRRNYEKLLIELDGEENRRAYFTSVICLAGWKDAPVYFSGNCYGQIAKEASGNSGFGYDPVFIPDGYTEPLAALGSEIKSNISHRATALQKLKEFLEIEARS
jgi:XTP/dITP diphosphohydrolase